jgi:hypothetical protein
VRIGFVSHDGPRRPTTDYRLLTTDYRLLALFRTIGLGPPAARPRNWVRFARILTTETVRSWAGTKTTIAERNEKSRKKGKAWLPCIGGLSAQIGFVWYGSPRAPRRDRLAGRGGPDTCHFRLEKPVPIGFVFTAASSAQFSHNPCSTRQLTVRQPPCELGLFRTIGLGPPAARTRNWVRFARILIAETVRS